MDAMNDTAVSRLHYELIRGLIQNGSCPGKYELAAQLGVTPAELDDIFRALAAIHGVVLHPHTPAPWIIHPFSLTPTLNWIEGRGRSWWAPCVWCGFGVAALVGGEVHLHSRYGAESDAMIIPVRDGVPLGFESVAVHFAIPPARAWDNVHEHCSMVLPFRSASRHHAVVRASRAAQRRSRSAAPGRAAGCALVWHTRQSELAQVVDRRGAGHFSPRRTDVTFLESGKERRPVLTKRLNRNHNLPHLRVRRQILVRLPKLRQRKCLSNL